MFCPKCGSQNPEGALNCENCGSLLQETAPVTNSTTERVPNYLVWSILTTIFCCLFTGIPAIVFSAKVDSKLREGDYNGAVEASKKAKMFIWITVGLGVLSYILFFLLFFGMFASLIGSVPPPTQYPY